MNCVLPHAIHSSRSVSRCTNRGGDVHIPDFEFGGYTMAFAELGALLGRLFNFFLVWQILTDRYTHTFIPSNVLNARDIHTRLLRRLLRVAQGVPTMLLTSFIYKHANHTDRLNDRQRVERKQGHFGGNRAVK